METSRAQFDVFLSRNSVDKPAVETLAHTLRNEEINPWLGKWHLVLEAGIGEPAKR